MVLYILCIHLYIGISCPGVDTQFIGERNEEGSCGGAQTVPPKLLYYFYI